MDKFFYVITWGTDHDSRTHFSIVLASTEWDARNAFLRSNPDVEYNDVFDVLPLKGSHDDSDVTIHDVLIVA